LHNDLGKIRVETVADFTSFRMAEPEFLRVLYQTASVRRNLQKLRRNGERFARLKFMLRMYFLARSCTEFANMTAALKFDLPAERDDLAECLKLLNHSLSHLSELVDAFKAKDLASEIAGKGILETLLRSENSLRTYEEGWKQLLSVYPEIPEFSLDDLVQKITPENRHKLLDWGPPVGKEVW
jgi:uncharacterized alpha-E superfamily protein